MATCFETNYKYEHTNREQIIQAIMNYGKCVKAENKARVGKYLCHADNMVGILFDAKNGQTLESGNQKPSVDAFFVTIDEIDDDTKRLGCDVGEFGVAANFGGGQNRCLANYHIEFSDKTLGGVSNSSDGFSFYSYRSNFTLLGANEFIWSTVGPLATMLKGRCEKVD